MTNPGQSLAMSCGSSCVNSIVCGVPSLLQHWLRLAARKRVWQCAYQQRGYVLKAPDGQRTHEYAAGEHPFLNDEAPRGDLLHNILHFAPLDPQHFNPDVPPALSQIILRLLRKDRTERYAHVQELHDALRVIR